MEIDIRKHSEVRAQVWAGLVALKVQARQIWGNSYRQPLGEIVTRLMVGVGDIARAHRDMPPDSQPDTFEPDVLAYTARRETELADWKKDLKKQLGNLIFSTIRWIDDLGLDPIECLELAIAAQEKFAKSGRPR